LRSKYGNALEGIEGEKIRVPRDKMSGAPRNGKFEECVVLEIAASRDMHINIYPLTIACQGSEKQSNVFFIDISTKLFSAKNFVEFG
jgi:hypothetical protein